MTYRRAFTSMLLVSAFSAALAGSVRVGSADGQDGARDPDPPVLPAVAIEYPNALATFVHALARLEQDPARRVRVLHFGDSNVAADLWTQVARETLQQRFGEGGSGYLVPPGHGSWHRGEVRMRTTGVWQSRRRGFARDFGPNDGLWGLAGVAVEPTGPGARLSVEVPAAGAARVLEVHMLGRPQPGAIEVQVDDDPPVVVDLQQERPGLVMRRFRLSSAGHRVRLRHVGGRPRLLGVVVERESGVVYDVLGINGHRINAMLGWDEGLLRAQLAHRRPDLVVLSYGGNEALDPNLPIVAYEAQLRQAVARIRGLTAGASCLLVGPLATYREHAPRMSAVTNVQRRVAPQLGCAFWDSSRLSGGHGSLRNWARYPGMVSGDHLHLGRRGYGLVGRAFVDALLAQYPSR